MRPEYAGNTIVAGGEGSYYNKYELKSIDNITGLPMFSKNRFLLPNADPSTYTKRLIHSNKTLYFAQTNGEILFKDNKEEGVLVKLDAAVRDIASDENNCCLYAACENGKLYKINKIKRSVQEIYSSSVSLWALAFNKEKNLLVFCDRKRKIYFLNMNTQELKEMDQSFGVIKRIKWIDQNRILYSRGGVLVRFNFSTGKSEDLCAVDNTIEDFCWDKERKYLIFISYTRNIYLAEYTNGVVLHEQGGAIDYLKGCCFIDTLEGASKGDFIVYGRDGVLQYNRINDERIISGNYLY